MWHERVSWLWRVIVARALSSSRPYRTPRPTTCRRSGITHEEGRRLEVVYRAGTKVRGISECMPRQSTGLATAAITATVVRASACVCACVRRPSVASEPNRHDVGVSTVFIRTQTSRGEFTGSVRCLGVRPGTNTRGTEKAGLTKITCCHRPQGTGSD